MFSFQEILHYEIYKFMPQLFLSHIHILLGVWVTRLILAHSALPWAGTELTRLTNWWTIKNNLSFFIWTNIYFNKDNLKIIGKIINFMLVNYSKRLRLDHLKNAVKAKVTRMLQRRLYGRQGELRHFVLG